MLRRAIADFLVAGVLVGAVGAVLVSPVLAAAKGGSGVTTVPDIYGGGLLFAFSGLDGKTLWADPFVASTVSGELAFRFHLPKEPILCIRLPEPGIRALEWKLVSNDLVVAKVPWDKEPLVVGFTSPNVVVGRLPPSCRVTLEGGETTCQLLRREVSDRTVFALAYDPKGAKGAAATASQALNTSIETLVEGRTDFFAAAPSAPDGTDRLRARALAGAFSVLKVNVYSSEPPITVRWTTPARWPQRDMGLWDSAFHSLGLMHLDVRLAREALQAVYGFQDDKGFIPHKMSPGGQSEISQPPILGWAAWQVYKFDRTPDRQFLEKSFDVVQKHVTWYMKERRLEGPPPPERPLEFGTPLYAWKTPEESGMENSPRFEGGSQFAAVDLSCYLANECRTLQTMAQQLGYRVLARTWGARADAVTEAARKQLWHTERGFFFDRKSADGPWIDVWTSAGLLALWSGVATPEQAERLKDHLVSKKFWTAAPVPSVARDDPKFRKDMWCGPMWVNINYLVIRGLQLNDFNREAMELREKTLAAVAGWYGRTGAVWEFYDCDGQTPPESLDRKGKPAPEGATPDVADYNWAAALYADLLIRPKP